MHYLATLWHHTKKPKNYNLSGLFAQFIVNDHDYVFSLYTIQEHTMTYSHWHPTDINISTGTVPQTAWGSGNVNHHLLPLQGANGQRNSGSLVVKSWSMKEFNPDISWYFEKDDVVTSDSGELVMSWKSTIESWRETCLPRWNQACLQIKLGVMIYILIHIDVSTVFAPYKKDSSSKTVLLQNILEFLNLDALPTLPVIQPPNAQVYIDSMLRRRELDEDLKWLDRFFGNGCQGVHNIVGVQWFQDDSGVLYSHQKL